LRFVLDQDVDARVQRVFHSAGHECWRSAEAGLATAEDDDLSVYAHNKAAVVVTHDRELTERRKRSTFGRHVRLKCKEPDACAILGTHMEEMIAVLLQHSDVVVEVSRSRVKISHAKWS
jgi:predicted nuclease of predicted toxin-antitoxin system